MLISPNPTDEEVDDALALLSLSVWAAEDEILRRLIDNLPLQIARKNAQFGYGANKGILVPSHYCIAPVRPTDEYLNCVAIRHRIDREPHGTDTFIARVNFDILTTEGPARINDQRTKSLQRSDLISAILHKYIGGCWNAQGKKCWSTLYPAHPAQSDLPDGWEKFSGVMTSFMLVQDEECNCWPE